MSAKNINTYTVAVLHQTRISSKGGIHCRRPPPPKKGSLDHLGYLQTLTPTPDENPRSNPAYHYTNIQPEVK